MILPKSLYDAKPAVFVALGFVISHMPAHWLSAVGGGLFALAGVMIFSMRKKK
jgi:uncharacterized membrane protein